MPFTLLGEIIMDNKKYEKLINFIINENDAKAKALFHEIVVEKSREIYESLMDEEGMGGQVGDLLDEINVEEEGMNEDDEDFGGEEDMEMDSNDEDFGDDSSEEDFGDDSVEFDGMSDDEEFGDEEPEEVEDAVIRIEDKLDQLMAEFEQIMGDKDNSLDMDSGDEDFGDEEDMDSDDEEESDEVMEAVALKKVSVTHGDDGAQKKSPTRFNAGSKGMDSKPVKFSGEAETVPTKPQRPSNPYTKGEKEVKGAGSFKNSPGKDNADLTKTPAPVKKDGASGTKSPVAESAKRNVKRPTRRIAR